MIYEHVCGICGKTYISLRPNGKYCSPECKKEGYRIWQNEKRAKKREERGEQWGTCPVCGKEFIKPLGKRSTYCSVDCRKEVERQYKILYAREKRAVEKAKRDMYKAVLEGTTPADEKYYEVAEDIPFDMLPTQFQFEATTKAESESASVKRKQNMASIAHDAIEAERLGMSYGQYQAMMWRKT